MKKNNDDLEYIRSRFEAENAEAPPSLSEQALFDKLNRKETEKHPVKMPRSKRKTIKSIVAVAACFAIIVSAGSGVHVYRMSGKAIPFDNKPGMSFFTSYRQLNNTMKEIDRKNSYRNSSPFFSGFSNNKYAVDGEVALTENASELPAGGMEKTGNAVSHAETNKQVDAVDEADIIKTDGNYIYYIPNDMPNIGTVKIYAAKDGKTELASEITVVGNVTMEEMYLLENTLVIVGTHNAYYANDYIYYDNVVVNDETPEEETNVAILVETTLPPETENETETEEAIDVTDITEPTEPETTTEETTENTKEETTGSTNAPELDYIEDDRAIALTYDITDRTSPVLTDIYEQSGSYLSSRMTGGTLYLVSYYNNYDSKIPVCGTGGSCERLPIENIVAVDDCNAADYAVIGAVNTADGSSTQTNAVLGVGSDIYCNENNLYLFGSIYQYRDHYYNFNNGVQTQIVKCTLDGTNVELTASARVDGTTDNQFSLDEKDGNLRIATTSTNSNWEDTNNLYVLDEALNEIGKVTGFADNEHIEAVRYVGDTAYVITFERTDPLFIIDLSNPKKPTITGEVKIDGFSTFLTPVDENTLLGIGYYTEENDFGGVYTDGLKLALFDISDKNNPRVLDEASFPNAYSAAQQTHKALVHNSEKGYYAIPLTVDDVTWNGYGEEIPLQHQYDNGILQFTLDGGRFGLKNLQAAIEPQRCTFIGDYLYAVDANGETVVSFPTE